MRARRRVMNRHDQELGRTRGRESYRIPAQRSSAGGSNSRVNGCRLAVAVLAAVGAPLFASTAGAVPLYHEIYRPQFHFTPARNWMNDPNGLIYHRGRYQLFFQYNPYGITFGNVSWGHAVSKDLVHWTQLPVAIPADNTEYVFSGSVVYDRRNTSGLGTRQNPPLVAVYTSAQKATGIQEQALAYSTDGGTTWTKYAANPVLTINSKNFRDPKVFWYAAGHEWMMVVARSDLRKVEFFSSHDLKHWTYLSSFGPAGSVTGVWECPDLFPLPVNGNAHHTKWVLVVNVNPGAIAGGSGTEYFLGRFDGTRFIPDSPATYTHVDEMMFAHAPAVAGNQPARWVDYGADHYASNTYNDAPNGRRIEIAWMNNWSYGVSIPTSPWRGADAFPREMSLQRIDGTVRLVQQPMPQLRSLRSGPPFRAANVKLTDRTRTLRARGKTLEIDALLRAGSATRLGLNVRVGDGHYTQIGYDRPTHRVYVDRRSSGYVSFAPTFAGVQTAPLHLHNHWLRLRVLVDASSVEVFANHGEVVLTDQIFPDATSTGVSLFAQGGSATLAHLKAWDLKSIWP